MEETPMAEGGGTYATCRLRGAATAGIYQQEGRQPPAWLAYVSVENAEVTAKRAEQMGATIISDVRELEAIGRIAVLADPNGGVFALWEPTGMAGLEIVNDPGAFCLTQLNTANPQAAQGFYRELFGWNISEEAGADAPYWGVYVGDAVNAGMMPNPNPGADNWLLYFTAIKPLEQSVMT